MLNFGVLVIVFVLRIDVLMELVFVVKCMLLVCIVGCVLRFFVV